MDVGTEDAVLPYRLARACPDWLFVGVDANGERMRATAARAARKPARGGATNLVLVQAHVETLPLELLGVATRVTVVLPWASLLRAVLGTHPAGLCGIASPCRADATVECVFSYDRARDGVLEDVTEPTASWISGTLVPRWAEAGLAMAGTLTQPQARALPTTWAKRLAFGHDRPVWRLLARRVPMPP